MQNATAPKMTQHLMRVAAFLIAVSALASAQDPTKVEPKHYRLDFENEHVQVIDVHYGPHEKSTLHDHPGGVVVCISGGHLRFTDENGKSHEVFSKPGEARWFPPFKHRVENVGETTYNAVYIGVKGMANAHASNLSPAEQQQQIAQALTYLASEPGALH